MTAETSIFDWLAERDAAMQSFGDGEQSKLEKAFWKFHREHPHIYEGLIEIARELRSAGVSYISIDHCFVVARHKRLMRTKGEDGFALNNNHRAYYSRLIMRDEPDLRDLFRLRSQRKQATIGPNNEELPSGEHVA